MSDHVFDGGYEHVYPSSKDAAGLNIGTVEPHEIRDTDGPLDHQWREANDEDRERWAKILAVRERAAAIARGEIVEDEAPGDDQDPGGTESDPDPADVDADADGEGEGTGEPHDETPAGPQPAAPAVIPQ